MESSNKAKMASDNNIYAMDIKALSMKRRERLMRQFLPDIERSQAKLGYVYKVNPFNYNSEHFNTVEIRRRPATTRPFHDTKVVMKSGCKAANETEPRPLWVKKPLEFTEKIYVNPNEEYTVYTRFYPWRCRESAKARYRFGDKSATSVFRSRTSQERGETEGLRRTSGVQTI